MERTIESMRAQPGTLAPGVARANIRPDAGLTFDDVLLLPRYSEIKSRRDVRTDTPFTPTTRLHIPIVSANMDTVTESEMAITMARAGGLGVIHRFMPIERQVHEVRRVKRAESLVVEHPLAMSADASVREARLAMERHGIGGVIIVDDANHVVGIVTRRDIMFSFDGGEQRPVSSVMTGGDKLITAGKDTSFEEARVILDRSRVEKLPLVDAEGRLAGLITAKDIEHSLRYPHATKDSKGQLRVAAAVGVRSGYADQAGALLDAGARALVIDIAHGDSANAIDAATKLRTEYGEKWDLIIGNVATGDGTRRLIDAGANAVKVGIGPGSICITRLVTGFGVPQLTAVAEAAAVAAPHNVPIIADGGVRNSGDIVKALAAGAQTVMLGSLLAGTREAPGIVVVRNGQRYKMTRGMASLGATMSRDEKDVASALGGNADVKHEYEQVVPEGVEATVAYRGPVEDILHQLVGGLRSGLSYGGASTIKELQDNAEFIRLTPAGLRESGPHDVDQL